MSRYSKKVYGDTVQTEAMFGKDQVKNNAGGYVFKVTPWQMLDRFLIIGTESNTYYCKSEKLTKDAADSVVKLIQSSEDNGKKVVDRIVEISDSGRAAKNEPAIFALALAASFGTDKVKTYALSNLTKVARTGTHLFQFVEDVDSMRGWGRGLRKAVGNWYNSKDMESLVYQVMKYKNRNTWTHKDVLSMSHPKPITNGHSYVFKSLFEGFDTDNEKLTSIEIPDNQKHAIEKYVLGMNFANIVKDNVKKAVKYIKEYNLPREVIPTQMLNEVSIWEALLEMKMPMTALLRNLGKMASIGMLEPFSNNSKIVINSLSNRDLIRKARLHPINILAAKMVYDSGRGFKGDNTWTVNNNISEVLEDAFYLSFEDIEPTGKRQLFALDISGSMGWGGVTGYPFITPAVANAAMVMAAVRSEKEYLIKGFGDTFRDLNVTRKMDLNTVLKNIHNLTFGGTDCSLPMEWALKNKIPVDVFSVWTDNETWCGNKHPVQALKNYRNAMGIDAKLIVCASTVTDFTIADPSDKGMLDVAGFDSSVPTVIREFSLL